MANRNVQPESMWTMWSNKDGIPTIDDYARLRAGCETQDLEYFVNVCTNLDKNAGIAQHIFSQAGASYDAQRGAGRVDQVSDRFPNYYNTTDPNAPGISKSGALGNFISAPTDRDPAGPMTSGGMYGKSGAAGYAL